MDFLKNVFPLSFKYSDTAANLVIGILIYIVASAVIGFVLGLLSEIVVIGLVFSLARSLASIYCSAGIVIEILVFCKVLK